MDVEEINLNQIFIDLSTLIGQSLDIQETLGSFYKALKKHFVLDQIYYFIDQKDQKSMCFSAVKTSAKNGKAQNGFPHFIPIGQDFIDTKNELHQTLAEKQNISYEYIYYFKLNTNSCLVFCANQAFTNLNDQDQDFDLPVLEPYVKNLNNYFGLLLNKSTDAKANNQDYPLSNLNEFKKYNLDFENLVNHIFQKSGIGLSYVSEGKFCYVNEYFSKILGYEPEEILGKSPLDFTLDENKANVEKQASKIINGEEEEISFIQAFLDKNDEIKYGAVKLSALKDNDGKYIGAFASVADVTKMTLAQKALEASELKYRRLFENAPYGISYSNMDANITMASTVASEILGYSPKELNDKPIKNIVAEKDHYKIDDVLAELIQGKQSIEKEYEILTKSGKTKIIRTKSAAIRNDELRIVGILNLFIDTTEDIKVKETLEQTKSNYELLYSKIFNGILIYDYTKHEVIDANENAIQLFAGTKKSLIGKNLEELIQHSSAYLDPNDTFNDFDEQKQKVLEGLLSSTPYVFKNFEGEEIIGDVSIIPFHNDENTAFVIINNLTENYKARQELQERKLIYQSLIENSFDGIDILEFQTDGTKVNETILIRNDKLDGFFSNLNGNFSRSNQLEQITPNLQANNVSTTDHFNYLLTELFQNKAVQSEFRLQQNNGNIIDTEIIFQIININEKTIIIRRFKDITDKKLQQNIIAKQIKDLNDKNVQLEKYINSNLQLENFAYIASHDLKAPLRSLSSFAYLLKNSSKGVLDEKSKNFLDIILTSARHMQILIEDLLEFSRVNTQKLQIQEIDPAKLIKNVMTDIQNEIEQTKAIINIGSLPKMIIADEIKLFQLFLNLIRNAIKFQQEDQQAIIDITGAEFGDHWAFNVRDNGIGIKEEHFDKIFNIFEKLHSNDVYEGTGLGLTICSKIVDQHDGDFTLVSKIEEGSTFSFTISKSLDHVVE